MRHLFLVNPAAGKKDRTREYQARIATACKDLNYEILVSRQPGDLTSWSRQAAASGEALRIYACGGDGTLNEVVNGVVGFPNVSVTHFPADLGTISSRFSTTLLLFPIWKLCWTRQKRSLT